MLNRPRHALQTLRNHDNPKCFMFQLYSVAMMNDKEVAKNDSAYYILALVDGGLVWQFLRPSFNSFTSVCGQVKRHLLHHLSR